MNFSAIFRKFKRVEANLRRASYIRAGTSAKAAQKIHKSKVDFEPKTFKNFYFKLVQGKSGKVAEKLLLNQKPKNKKTINLIQKTFCKFNRAVAEIK